MIDLTVLLERMALSSAMKKISKMTVTLSKFAPALVRAQECLARMCMPFHLTNRFSHVSVYGWVLRLCFVDI